MRHARDESARRLPRLVIFGAVVLGVGLFGFRGAGHGEMLKDSVCGGGDPYASGGGGFGCSRAHDGCTTSQGNGSSLAAFHLSGRGTALGVDQLSIQPSIDMTIENDAFANTAGGQTANAQQSGVVGSCAFSIPGTTEIVPNDIQVVTALAPNVPGDCADSQKCIQCTVTTGAICTVQCAGKVPTDTVVDVDSFKIVITFTHSFKTTQPHPKGMIRFDGFADLWPEFLSEGASPDFVTTDGCNGGAPGEMVLNNLDPLGIDRIVADTAWDQSFGIDDTSLGGQCVVTTSLTASMPLAGVHLTGSVDITRGPISLVGTICDQDRSAKDCPAPTHP